MNNLIPYLFFVSLIFSSCKDKPVDDHTSLAEVMENSIKTELLNKWYPQSRDTVYGGFFSTYTYDFKLTGSQNKMIVSQARHVWTNAKAATAYPEENHYLESAAHGFKFLRDVMWDKTHGGFHTLVDRQGNVISSWSDEKTAYGNSFGIYGLAAYYMSSKDTSALNLAKKAFIWLEQHSHDPVHKGYFQHMRKDGTPIQRPDTIPSTAETGYPFICWKLLRNSIRYGLMLCYVQGWKKCFTWCVM